MREIVLHIRLLVMNFFFFFGPAEVLSADQALCGRHTFKAFTRSDQWRVTICIMFIVVGWLKNTMNL